MNIPPKEQKPTASLHEQNTPVRPEQGTALVAAPIHRQRILLAEDSKRPRERPLSRLKCKMYFLPINMRKVQMCPRLGQGRTEQSREQRQLGAAHDYEAARHGATGKIIPPERALR
jgi:hypothetical protein